jgi:LysM repeat protein
MGGGLLYALISVVLVVGGLSLALAEGNNSKIPTLAPSQTALPATFTSTPVAQDGITATSLVVPSSTQTSAALTNCVPPAGWVLITVQPGDSLSILAARYLITPEQLELANCLSTQNIPPGYGIFVPIQITSTTISCGPYSGWVRNYIVKPGDTLFHIATIYRTTAGELERANCKSNSTIIFAGERLWVPNVPTITPGVTNIPNFDTPTGNPTEPLTLTPLPFTATVFTTDTSEPDPTSTP